MFSRACAKIYERANLDGAEVVATDRLVRARARRGLLVHLDRDLVAGCDASAHQHPRASEDAGEHSRLTLHTNLAGLVPTLQARLLLVTSVTGELESGRRMQELP
jgi:hypothetical protein